MLDIVGATKNYGSGPTMVTALKEVTLKVGDGDFVAIMGPSGSGKSTLLNIIGGLDSITSGRVVLNGQRIDNLDENDLVAIRRGKVAYVFQQYHLLPSLTAIENVLLPLLFCGNGNDEAIAMDMLKRVGLEKRANHKPGQLSGGEQQRVAIARALVNRPSLILADEPTGNMDQKTGTEILNLFQQLNKEGHSLVMVTHSNETAGYAKRTVQLKDGEIVSEIKNAPSNGHGQSVQAVTAIQSTANLTTTSD